jgi:hypothetical protein
VIHIECLGCWGLTSCNTCAQRHLLRPQEIACAWYGHDQAMLLKHSLSFQSVFPESQAETTQVLYMNHSVHSLMHNQLQAPVYRRVICVVCCHTNNIMPNLRFSQQWCWRSSSSGMWCCVAGWVILTFLKDCIAFIFKGSWRQYNPSHCLADQLARQGSSCPLAGPGHIYHDWQGGDQGIDE